MLNLIEDPYFNIHILAMTKIVAEPYKHLGPNGLAWANAHRCYSEEPSIIDNPPSYTPRTEEEAGQRLLGQILKPGHFGVLENFGINLEVVGFPHNVIAQARTHRVAVNFAVTSQRYSGQRILELVEEYYRMDSSNRENFDLGTFLPGTPATELFLKVGQVFYARPEGIYTNREGKKYEVFRDNVIYDLLSDFETAKMYHQRVVKEGYSEEHARDRLAQSIRQSFTVNFNIRSLMHMLDLRSPANAQLEIRTMAYMLFDKLKEVAPDIAAFYEKSRLGKNKIAP